MTDQRHGRDHIVDGEMPFVPVDQAREQPKSLDPNAADTSGVVDDGTDVPEDVTAEETTAIYQEGTTLLPPG